jgi:hypothetical protein
VGRSGYDPELEETACPLEPKPPRLTLDEDDDREKPELLGGDFA